MSTPNTDAGTPLQTAVRKQKTADERRIEREREERYRRYSCAGCGTLHKDSWDASHCCGPESKYVCPVCNDTWGSVDDAEDCERAHGAVGAASLEFARCPVCDEPTDDTEEAVQCCLWRTMPFADRLTLIDHVRFGRLDAAHAMIGRH